MGFKDDGDMSDNHSLGAQSTNVNFKLAYCMYPPCLSPVLSTFAMLAHLFLLRRRTHDISARKQKRQGTTPILEP
jgi:hypothetical protein